MRHLLLLVLVSLVTGCAWIPRSVVNRADHSDSTKYQLVEGSPLYDLIPRGWISAVNKPTFATVAAATEFMSDEEPVMVVERGDVVRIYSTWYLDGHEVVNDTIEGEPIAVTWCPLVQAGVAFERSTVVDGESTPLTLQASGKLWRDALVMWDKQTKSLWTQHDGRALNGPSRDAGAQLPSVPSTHTTWAEARARHPQADVLRKKGDLLGSGQKTIYDDYLARTDQLGIFGTHLADDALPGKTLVLGFVRPESAYAISLPGLESLGGAAMSVGGDPVFAHALPGGKAARVWHRAAEGSNALFELSVSDDGKVVRDATQGLAWDAFDGSSQDGGVALRGIEGHVVYYFAWQQNHPDGRVWAGESFADPRAPDSGTAAR
ncbi:MAG: DUF3179 domain-containing protein [Deltaproteobacteria bacterium]|nr:DUF3179 domain-containing protein [Deltaproteobacteria bacterium]